MTGSKLKLFVIVESVLGYVFVALLTLGLLRIEYRRLDVSGSSRILTNLANTITTYMGSFMFLVVLITLIYCLIRLVQTSRKKGWAELDALDWYFIFRPRSINVGTLHFKLNGEELSRDEYVSLGYHHPLWSWALIDFWKPSSGFGPFIRRNETEPSLCPSGITMVREFLRFILVNTAKSIGIFLLVFWILSWVVIVVGEVVVGYSIAGLSPQDFPPFMFLLENFKVLLRSTSIWDNLLLVNIITIAIKTVKSSSSYASSVSLTSNANASIIDEKLVPGMFRNSVMAIRDSLRFKLDDGYYSYQEYTAGEVGLKKLYNLYSSGSTPYDLTLRLTGRSIAEQLREQKEDFIPIENALFSKGHAFYLPPFSTLPFASFQSTELRDDHLGFSTVHFIDITNDQIVIEFADKRFVVNILSSDYGYSKGFLVGRDSSLNRLSPDGSPEASEAGSKVTESVVEETKNGEWPSEEEMNRQYKELAKSISAEVDAFLSVDKLQIHDTCLVWMVVNWKDSYHLRLKIEKGETNNYTAFFVLGEKAVN